MKDLSAGGSGLHAKTMSEPQARTSSMEELYTANAQRAGRLAYFLVGDKELAQDLVQEAFLKVFTRWGNLREPQAFAAYLNRTIVNLANKTHRRRGIERRYLERQSRLEAMASERDRPPRESFISDCSVTMLQLFLRWDQG